MLQIIKAQVNGKEGFVCQLSLPNAKPQTIAVTSKQDIADLLDKLV